MHNEASRITLEQEFGTSDYRQVIFHILEKGESQENIVRTDPSLLTCYPGFRLDQPLSHTTKDHNT
jgi:hypothetical protein